MKRTIAIAIPVCLLGAGLLVYGVAAENANAPTAWWKEAQDPKRINTAGWEDSPFMTPDGKKLYFMYTPHNFFPMFMGGTPQKAGPARPGHRDSYNGNPFLDSDTYVCERRPDGSWSEPKACEFNDKYGDACGMLARDGKRFYYLTQTKPQPVEPTLHVIELGKDGVWGRPVDLGLAAGQEKHKELFRDDNPHIAADEKTIWFTSLRPGGRGKKDLWVTKKGKDGAWGPPENLGPEFNTDDDEDQIWVSKDEQTVYFNRGAHIYWTERKDGKWRPAARVDFGSDFMAAEASLTDDMQTMIFMYVDLQKKDIIVVSSSKDKNGKWSPPKPLD